MLKTKQVGKYTVTEMGLEEQVRLRLFLGHVKEAMTDKVTKQPIGNNERQEAYESWAYVAACTKPLIPIEEALTTSLSVMNPLQLAVKELNPDMFGDAVDPAQAKKKKRRPSAKSPKA